MTKTFYKCRQKTTKLEGLIVMQKSTERYTEQEIIDNMEQYVTRNNVKYCVTNVETGEVVTSNDIRAIRGHIREATKYDRVSSFYITGVDKKGVEYLKHYAITCRIKHEIDSVNRQRSVI